MTATTYSPTLRDFLSALAPGKISRDPFGFVSGYRSYVIFSQLNEKSDSDLRLLGLSRQDIPRVAVDAAKAIKA